MVSLNEIRFECVHCGNCCCDTNTIVNITYTDILRIKHALNFTIEEMLEILSFYVYDEKINYVKQSRMVISPIQTENGLAFVGLRKQKSGDCVFYNNKKKRCSVYVIRPNFCRTFPFYFYYSSKESIPEQFDITIDYTKKGLEYCQGISKHSLLIDYKYWLDLGNKVLDDLVQNEKFTFKWNQKNDKNKIKLTAKNYLLAVFMV
jgi:Fe-S-cluster containining protein